MSDVPVSTYGTTQHSVDLDKRAIVDWFEHDIEVVVGELTLGKEELRARLLDLAQHLNEHCHIAFRDHWPEVVLDFPVPYGAIHYESTPSDKVVTCDVILLAKSVKERYTVSWQSIKDSVTDIKGGWMAAYRRFSAPKVQAPKRGRRKGAILEAMDLKQKE
jgi:hypothetical protein